MMQYMYLGRPAPVAKGVKGKAHKGIVCIGYEMPDEGVKSTEFSVSYCSPGDAFAKKKAHSIINGRFAKGMTQVVEVDTDATSPSYESIRTAIIGALNVAMSRKAFEKRYGGSSVAGINMPRWMTKQHVG